MDPSRSKKLQTKSESTKFIGRKRSMESFLLCQGSTRLIQKCKGRGFNVVFMLFLTRTKALQNRAKNIPHSHKTSAKGGLYFLLKREIIGGLAKSEELFGPFY